jgi:hypothetical protein
MTETTGPTEAMAASNLSVSPSDILLHLIITLLAPTFLVASGGDIYFARVAALDTVNAYRARDHADLIAIAQIIACGLTGLGSLSLSMADDISLSMTLRLRGNAVALSRVAEQNRRTLRESRPGTAPLADMRQAGEPEDFDEAVVVANVAAMQQRTAETLGRMQAEASASCPTPALIPTPVPIEPSAFAASVTAPEQQIQAMWASAMTDVAGEFTASLPHLPPAQRKTATIRAAALSSTANTLISGTAPPHLKPGDLAATIRPTA